jgi:anhydro-N-acetylmuramic acid kinase
VSTEAGTGLFIGLMSGTSLDGVDGVLVRAGLSSDDVLAFVHHAFAPSLRHDLLALNRSGSDELHRAALAGNAIAHSYAAVVHELLMNASVPRSRVRALGAHGQTVRHRPSEFDGIGYTLQVLNGALLAELSGIDVVCDLRSRDLAAGGQAAPLVPAFHAWRFSQPGRDVAVLNVGGIANLTLLPAQGDVRGFDCGPGNVLMDLWCQRHRGQVYDDGGIWAAGGTVDSALLAALLGDPYFARQPPKSTGRDLFDSEWLDARVPPALAPQDVIATLAECTARAAADALALYAPDTRRLRVCGGGAFNAHLMRRLAALCPTCTVDSTALDGVPPDHVEALAFAWLAQAFVTGQPGNLPAVTGARGLRRLGALYPAH